MLFDTGCTGVSATGSSVFTPLLFFSFFDCVIFTSCYDSIVSWFIVGTVKCACSLTSPVIAGNPEL